MSFVLRPGQREDPFRVRNVADQLQQGLSSGIQTGFDRQRSSDILDQVLAQAQSKDGDLLTNIIKGLQGSGATLDQGLETLQRFSPIFGQQEITQRELFKNAQEEARLKAERDELARIETGRTQQAGTDSLFGPIQNTLSQTLPLQQVQQQIEPSESDLLDFALESPRVNRIFNQSNNLRNQISSIDKQIDEVNQSTILSEKAKESATKRKEARKKSLIEDLNRISTPEEDDKKFLSNIRSEAEKSRSQIPKFNRIEKLLPTASIGTPWRVAGRDLNPFNASTRTLVNKGVFTPEQQELQSLVFDIVRDQFPTLPRIETEFEEIMNRNISALQTEEGNRALLRNLRLVNQLNIRKDQIRNELLDQNIPENLIPEIISRLIETEENIIINNLRNDFSTPQERQNALRNILSGRG